jgi:peptide/nickel transport system ATP-binding protein
MSAAGPTTSDAGPMTSDAGPMTSPGGPTTSPRGPTTSANILELEGLCIEVGAPDRRREVVTNVSFHVARGETLGIVGESGSGKTLTMLSLLRLLPPGAVAAATRACFDGRELFDLTPAALRALCGRDIGVVFQDPLTALNPLLTIGRQITEVLRRHIGLADGAARQRATLLLGKVGIPDPALRLGQYPHEFSGGMRQRVTIAMALAGEPRLLIADEPTTALDVTVQAEIVSLIQRLQREQGLSVVWVTHDLALLARIADRVLVMRAGQIVEEAPAARLFTAPRHPYARSLLAAVRHEVQPAGLPEGGAASERLAAPGGERGAAIEPAVLPDADGGGEILLQARDLAVTFQRHGFLRAQGRPVQALRGVDLDIRRGETLALVGESGSGKSTLARALLRNVVATAGSVAFDGRDITRLAGRELRGLRRRCQMVFQDPFSSLNPRRNVGAAIAEPLIVHGLARGQALRDRVRDCLTMVGLDASVASRRPHEFSGGQRQRICIARAIACQPDLIVADEALSALDVSLQTQIIDLFERLKQRCALTYLFISHDLSVVRRISDRVAVMYLGQVVELAPTAQLFADPAHPYTAALLAAVPVPDPLAERKRVHVPLRGEPPSPANPPAGCAFHTRCPHALSRCRAEAPRLRATTPGRHVACHLFDGTPSLEKST